MHKDEFSHLQRMPKMHPFTWAPKAMEISITDNHLVVTD